jgi:hypothetical protein
VIHLDTLFVFRRRAANRCAAAIVCAAIALQSHAQNAQSPLQLVTQMVAHEDDEAAHRDRYEFLSNERSERTGGHLWTERVVETASGRLRMLIAEDGKPLSAERQQAERERLAAIVADPDAFILREQTQKSDEVHARQMLDLLPHAFLFDNVRLDKGVWRMDFHPNPNYSPSGIEQHVLCGMSGWVAIDEKQQRLIHIEGHLPQDVSIGFGLLATIHAGSHFGSDRMDADGHWRTVRVITDIRGKAALFKSVSKNSEVTRSEFKYLEPGITIAQAVALLES